MPTIGVQNRLNPWVRISAGSIAASTIVNTLAFAYSTEQVGFLLVMAGIWVFGLLLIPFAAAIGKAIPWISPLSILGVFLFVGFGPPLIYHLYYPDALGLPRTLAYIIEGIRYGQYGFILGNIGVGISVVYLSWAVSKQYFKGELQPLKRRVPCRATVAFGLIFAVVGLVATSILHGGVDGYLDQFNTLGVRTAPSRGMARFRLLADFTIPGVLFLYAGLASGGQLRGVGRYSVLLLFLIGLIPLVSLGGRAVVVKYVVCWIVLISIQRQKLPVHAAGLGAIAALILVIGIGRLRLATSQERLFGEEVNISTLVAAEMSQPQNLALVVDKIAGTAVPFVVVRKPLWGETYVGGWLRSIERPIELLGISVPITGAMSITEYQGQWIVGDPETTGLPTSMFGEDYANFGPLGIAISSMFLGVVIAILDRKIWTRYVGIHLFGLKNAGRPFEDVMLTLWVVLFPAQVLWGGWGSVISLLAYFLVPLHLVRNLSLSLGIRRVRQ